MAKKKKSIVVKGEVVFVQENQIQSFQEEVLKLVEHGDMNHIEAIAHYCQLCDVEIESVVNLISPYLMSMIEEEAIKSRLIKTTDIAKLPV